VQGQSVLPGDGHVLLDEPEVELAINQEGRLSMLTSKPGRYELISAGGEIKTVSIESVPAAQKLPGPWELRFQPKRGAPEMIRLDELMDWSKHENPGVKYFSGTATYRNSFLWNAVNSQIPAGQTSVLDSRPRFYLDLGEVQVMAQVKLNGRDLGILWKKPFIIEISDALTSGENILEITVANLWPNRLIGDQIQPREKHVTWTTWNPYKAYTPLLESGLIGPVELKAAVELTVQ